MPDGMRDDADRIQPREEDFLYTAQNEPPYDAAFGYDIVANDAPYDGDGEGSSVA